MQDSRHGLGKETSFAFNGVFEEERRTAQIYQEAISPIVNSVMSGFNATCFAYGMTGAGKTHTMFGDLYFSHVREEGVVLLAVREFFGIAGKERAEFSVKVSYLEIYNEQVRDLLSSKPGNRPQGLLLVEDAAKGITVPDLIETEVRTMEEVIALVIEGNERRTMAATGANQFSTRSHAVLQITIERKNHTRDVLEEVTTSKLCLIDLAGSERAAATDNRGIRLLEGANINRSLLALGNCINILSDSTKNGKFVPYRDSKLTRLLKDSLGGKTRTVMLACISPSSASYEETLHTLKYAERARKIKVKVTRNVREVEAHVSEYKSIISSLKTEIEFLREQLRSRSTETEGVDALGQDMLHNLEEFWELKQSIQEVETLNEENKRQIRSLLEDLELVQSMQDEPEESRAKKELKRLHANVKENEDIRTILLQNLQTNLKRKSQLQRTLASLQDDKRRGELEMQVAYHALKMEKVDLYVQNQEMKQKVLDSQKASDQKEKVITQMKREMEEMRRRLKPDPESIRSDFEPEESLKSISPRPVQRSESRGIPVRSLKISNLQDARTLRKTESKREMKPADSTEGFISSFLAVNPEPQTDQQVEPPSSRRVHKVASAFKAPGQFSNLHKVTPKPSFKSLHRSVSTTRERHARSPLNTSRPANKVPLSVINNQVGNREETEKLVRKNFRRIRGTTPTVAISLVPKSQC